MVAFPMLLSVLLACNQDAVTGTNETHISTASKEAIPVECAPEPAWVRVSSTVSADSTRPRRITLQGTLTGSACELQLELRDAAAARVLSVTIPAPPGKGATSTSSGTVEAPTGTLELWVAATGPIGASATYTYTTDVVHSKTTRR